MRRVYRSWFLYTNKGTSLFHMILKQIFYILNNNEINFYFICFVLFVCMSCQPVHVNWTIRHSWRLCRWWCYNSIAWKLLYDIIIPTQDIFSDKILVGITVSMETVLKFSYTVTSQKNYSFPLAFICEHAFIMFMNGAANVVYKLLLINNYLKL